MKDNEKSFRGQRKVRQLSEFFVFIPMNGNPAPISSDVCR